MSSSNLVSEAGHNATLQEPKVSDSLASRHQVTQTTSSMLRRWVSFRCQKSVDSAHRLVRGSSDVLANTKGSNT
eukprot:3559408-Amphidinium_carterae.2